MLLVAVGVLAAIYSGRILPLASLPGQPPAGLGMAWAGPALSEHAQSVYIRAESCHEPVSVVLDLFPAATQDVAPGMVALAFAGGAQSIHTIRPRVYLSKFDHNNNLRPLRAGASPADLPEATPFTRIVRTAGSVAYSFYFDPQTMPIINVAFSARWTARRTGDDTCWLNIPKQLGLGENRASVPANAILGHATDWTRSAIGFPISNSHVYLHSNDAGSTLPVDPTGSLPIPQSLDPPSWACGAASAASTDCQVFALLARPGADAKRTRDLTLWSIAGGLVLALLGDALIAILRSFAIKEAHVALEGGNPPPWDHGRRSDMHRSRLGGGLVMIVVMGAVVHRALTAIAHRIQEHTRRDA